MDGIVLLAKLPGLTSFSSLHNVKKAFNTTKVGHTGTLDNFAQGLLVVCVGKLTRLAGNITEFNKSYKAVIKFGEETDTLDYEGKIVKTTNLPELDTVKKVLSSFVGEQFQSPPVFSSIHVDGKRASELVRKGVEVEIPKRKITVYSANLLDMKIIDNKVAACLVDFSVSKGTYIRCLARDIGKACNSSAHLLGLFRTKVGNFNVEDAAGFNLLPEFSISSCEELSKNNKDDHFHDEELQNEIGRTIKPLDEDTAKLCGYAVLHLKNSEMEQDFRFARPIRKRNFIEFVDSQKDKDIFAVFTTENIFCGLLEWKDEERNRLGYKFVIQDKE